MSEKLLLIFSVFCGILSQEIIGIFLEDTHHNSSSLHLRNKRMIGQEPFRNGRGMITDAIQIVKVLQNNEIICAGVRVSPNHILTPKKCVSEQGARYTVESGAPYGPMEIHSVDDELYRGDLSLLLIRPSFRYASPSFNRQTPPAEESLSAYMHASIIAWDSTGRLRPISPVPIVNMLDCGHQYISYEHPITEDNICTGQLSGRNRCSKEDVGSALVVGDKLFGVLLSAGSVFGQRVPDVFIRVYGNEYYNWIEEHI